MTLPLFANPLHHAHLHRTTNQCTVSHSWINNFLLFYFHFLNVRLSTVNLSVENIVSSWGALRSTENVVMRTFSIWAVHVQQNLQQNLHIPMNNLYREVSPNPLRLIDAHMRYEVLHDFFPALRERVGSFGSPSVPSGGWFEIEPSFPLSPASGALEKTDLFSSRFLQSASGLSCDSPANRMFAAAFGSLSTNLGFLPTGVPGVRPLLCLSFW